MGLSASPIVSVAWLNEHRSEPGIKIVDVRSTEQYLNGHIPGAISFDVMNTRLLSSTLEAVARWKESLQALIRNAGIVHSDTLIAYEDISGTSAAYAVWLADVAGLANSGMIDGGFNAWLATGFEVTGDPTTVSPSDFTLTANDSVIATAQSISQELVEESPLQIVDTRTDDEFSAATIPGANHLEWTRSLNRDGTFRPLEEIREQFVEKGFDLESDAPVATFCGSGLRAAHSYVVLKQLGVKHPQNYGPSWSEWGRQPQLPKQKPDASDI